jgi:signal transduction histidine kinase
MRLARRPRRALGLRGRIVGVVLFTAVATLAVAAVALLGPLESSLRSATLQTLHQDVESFRGHRPLAGQFAGIDFAAIPFVGFAPAPSAPASSTSSPAAPSGAPLLAAPASAAPSSSAPAGLASSASAQLAEQGEDGARALRQLDHILNGLATTTGSSVYLFGYPDVDGGATPIAHSSSAPPAAAGNFSYVRRAFLTHSAAHAFGTIRGTENAFYAVPFELDGARYALALERPITEITASAHAVARAFVFAALAALALSVLFGIPLSARLARRLRTLREVALRIAADGSTVRVPDDRTLDEVGDLSRSLATMQLRLEHQEEARRAFVATASHELRTPLTSLEGMLELLDEDLSSPSPDLEDARELLRSARTQSRRLAQLAADLLDLSRLDADVALRSEPIELCELARAVLAEFQLGTRARRDVTTSIAEAGEPLWAMGDPGSVARILRILLDNAVRISPEGGEVTVRLRARPKPALSVCDQGPGVDPSERELIFKRFHRGRSTGGSGGFGLGLAIGRELAERMGGSLVLEPSSGRGAIFTLTLEPAPGQAAPSDLLRSAGAA